MTASPAPVVIGFDLAFKRRWHAAIVGVENGCLWSAVSGDDFRLLDQILGAESLSIKAICAERPVRDDQRDHSGRRYRELSETLSCIHAWYRDLHQPVAHVNLMAPTCADVRRWAGLPVDSDRRVKEYLAAQGYDVSRGKGLGNADQRDAMLCALFARARVRATTK